MDMASNTLCLVLIFLSCVALSLQIDVRNSNSNSPRAQAEKLIRALNLFPTHEANIHAATRNATITPSGIVEKQFKLPLQGDPGTSGQDLAHHAGYYTLPNTVGARMFYFFFESRGNKTDPVVIWLTGGPGCGSELALFYENGPFYITKDLSLAWNDFGWDKVSNILFVDQPTGTGFSYTSDERDIRSTEEEVSNDLYNFLQAFFKEHPQYVTNGFFITGESYAGHYIPALASRIHNSNKNNEGTHINMKGFAIGNGLTNTVIQYRAYPDYALNMSLIQQSDYDSLQSDVLKCEAAAKPCGPNDVQSCESAYGVCQRVFDNILFVAGNINFYDIRKKCEGQLCYDFSNLESFLNQETVKKALGVGNIDYVSCSTKVKEAMTGDFMRNLAVGIPDLLDRGIKMLVYAGEYDLTCNWLGNARWVDELVWTGQKGYAAAHKVEFIVDGKAAGLKKEYGALTFLKVYNAGHLVPMDQPKPSSEMLSRWMKGVPL